MDFGLSTRLIHSGGLFAWSTLIQRCLGSGSWSVRRPFRDGRFQSPPTEQPSQTHPGSLE